MAIQNNLTHVFKSPTTNILDIQADETLNKIFLESAEKGVSDVHFEDEDGFSQIRIRDGNDLKVVRDDLSYELLMVMRRKMFNRCRISEATADSTPTDGRFFLKFDNFGRVDFRLSSAPTAKGFSVVCRLLDQKNAQVSFHTIQMLEAVRQAILEVISQPSGLFLVTGPTGSGKTTTLYSIINELNKPEKKIITVEDPVEYVVPNLQQIDVDQHTTFHSSLRAALRQDPDIILIGEIRDKETANIAIQAALTGHLVISTLHTNSALQSVHRMIEMGVEPTLLAQVLKGVAAQRLVRKLSSTRFVADALDSHKQWLSKNGFKHLLDSPFGISYDPSKYSGRLPIIEFALITGEMREAIATLNLNRLQELAEKQPQYQTLAQAGVEQAMNGLTSLEEVVAISDSAIGDSLEGLKIGERLVRLKYLTKYQVDVILEKQKSQPLNQRQLFGEICVEMNFCKQEHIDDAFGLR
jgi:type II secretory ATPase GspE/PulE/Tfp pilus assembly ATPase PilB-like protein